MNGIELTKIDFKRIRGGKLGLLGFVSFILNDTFAVNGVAVYSRIEGEGIRLVWPTRKRKTGKDITLFHPLRKDTYKAIETAVYGYIQTLDDDEF